MRKRISPLSVFILLLQVFSATQTALAGQSVSLQVKGSDTMVNLVQAWSEDYTKKNPDLFIAVTGGGSGTGIAALIGGTCDLAASSRNIKAKEIDLAKKKGIEPKEFIVALDGLAVIVNPNNPVSQLTMDQLAGIFTGKIKNWKEVGGTDAEIVILSREVNSGTHVYFKEHVLRKGDEKSKEEFSPEALLLPSSQAIADEIAQNPSAIGYYGMGYISPNQKAVSIAKDAASEFIYPKTEDVTSGKYPISRPLFVYTKGEPQGDVRQFMDFILSDEGQSAVAKADFVPIKKQ